MRAGKFNEDVLNVEEGDRAHWLRPIPATKYFNMGKQTIDRIAIQCDAKKKVCNKIVLYDVEKIEEYLRTL
jgi:hypothetical protein